MEMIMIRAAYPEGRYPGWTSRMSLQVRKVAVSRQNTITTYYKVGRYLYRPEWVIRLVPRVED